MAKLSDDPAFILDQIELELKRARKRHPQMNSAHEAYAVILEELDEFWDSVKNDDVDGIELVQVAAMCVRAIDDLGLDYEPRGRVVDRVT